MMLKNGLGQEKGSNTVNKYKGEKNSGRQNEITQNVAPYPYIKCLAIFMANNSP